MKGLHQLDLAKEPTRLFRQMFEQARVGSPVHAFRSLARAAESLRDPGALRLRAGFRRLSLALVANPATLPAAKVNILGVQVCD